MCGAFIMLLLVLLSCFLCVCSAPIADSNQGTVVRVRVEGAEKTTFEGLVFTKGHDVDPPSTGILHCDGTNNNHNPSPGPTFTGALDDAAKQNGFTWDGNPQPQFDDIFITSIAGDTNNTVQFWGLLLNFQFIPVDGCQQRVELLDEVLFAFDAFNKVNYLKLTGPEIVHKDTAATFTIIDGRKGVAIAGADLDGQMSDANGHVSLSFSKLGLHELKAEKADSIRSNGLKVIVIP